MTALPTNNMIVDLLESGSASDALDALNARFVTSTELLEAQLQRIEQFDGPINAVVATDVARARREATAADEARAAGKRLGPLHGLPMTIKDTYETQGLVTASGAVPLADFVPLSDADMTQALRQAGAIVFAKTNVPLFAGDHQTYNGVYGTTNNPFGLDRTAGGSSGGAAAAVAAGFTLAEVGSDIGASIRLPSAFNGVFGLKPTHGVLSLRGHIPGPTGTLAQPHLSVAGPIARSAEDLALLMDVLVEVGSFDNVPGAALPEATPRSVDSLRIGIWSDDDEAPVSAGVRETVEALGSQLAAAGSTVVHNAHPSVSSARLHETYLQLLMPHLGAGFPDKAYDRMAEIARQTDSVEELDQAARRGAWAASSHRDWLKANERRAKAIASWDKLFDKVDLVVAPVAPTVAFPHNYDERYNDRVTDIDGVEHPYTDILFWAGIATMPGLPSAVIPAGTADGMPCGVQLIAKRWSDLQLLVDASTICQALGISFKPPTLSPTPPPS